MKNKKLKLENLKVQSFVTTLAKEDKSTLQVQGGTGIYCSLLGEGCDDPKPKVKVGGGGATSWGPYDPTCAV